MSSIINTLLGPECGLDIYEEPDENVWVDCATRRVRYSLIIIPIIVVITMIMMFFMPSAGPRFIVFLFGAIIVGGTIFSQFWIPKSARIDHQRVQREVKSYMAKGYSLKDATDAIRGERLQREENDARISAARIQSSRSQSGGLVAGAVLGSLFKR